MHSDYDDMYMLHFVGITVSLNSTIAGFATVRSYMLITPYLSEFLGKGDRHLVDVFKKFSQIFAERKHSHQYVSCCPMFDVKTIPEGHKHLF